ncbi:hypothetical protein CASFOL_004005 [Castilleja foliolosa]|uniref:Protein BIG GRAIN 1-like E n=1 Tax=Castilleja foliolosa TaxID=1961234 RepID=A0ABD3EMC2_9LAMI
MSVTSYRKSDSGELDVFEATRYFSNANEIYPGPESGRFNSSQTFGPGKKPASRRSLDMPIIITNPINPTNIALDRKKSKDNKKLHKQPSSPGGKLIANLINSIFNQTGSKKKKKSGQNQETDQSPGESRKRRSSISHLRIITNTNDSKSSDFYAKTPTKSSYKDLFRKYPVSGPGNGDNLPEKKKVASFSGLGNRNLGLLGRADPTATRWADDDQERDDYFRKFKNDKEDDSDSSSDLFDLPINGDLGFYSNGLPVYGTTRPA